MWPFSKPKIEQILSAEELTAEDLLNKLNELHKESINEIKNISDLNQNINKIKTHISDLLNSVKISYNIRDHTMLLIQINKNVNPLLNKENKLDERFKQLNKIVEKVTNYIGSETNSHEEKIKEVTDYMLQQTRIYDTSKSDFKTSVNILLKEMEKLPGYLIDYTKENLDETTKHIIDVEKKLEKHIEELQDLNEQKDVIKKLDESISLCNKTIGYLDGLEIMFRNYLQKVDALISNWSKLKEKEKEAISNHDYIEPQRQRNQERREKELEKEMQQDLRRKLGGY